MKLAIIKSQKDLLRIIPFPNRSSIESIDFEISTLGNNYSIEYWHQGIHDPEIYTTTSDITYHSSVKKNERILPGIVQIKEGDRISGIVSKIKFPKVADVLIDSVFPIPLLKLTIAEDVEDVDKIYTKKSYHRVFDFDEMSPSNALEVYVVGKNHPPNEFLNKWPCISALWEITQIDYVTKGVYPSQQFFDRLNRGDTIKRTGVDFENCVLWFRFYKDENIKTNKICFYENYDYISMLGTTKVQQTDARTKKPLSTINPAYYYDLNKQIKDGATKDENELWNNFFENSDKRISKLDIKRVGFSLLQI